MRIIPYSLMVMLPLLFYAQTSTYKGFSFDFTKFNTQPIFVSQYNPRFRYFEDYRSKGGFEFSYLRPYNKFMELAPGLGIHYFKNNSTLIRGLKTDFFIKNYFKVSKKNVVFLRIGSAMGFSLFTIWNSIHSNYFYTHTYKSILFNIDASLFCQLAEDIYLKGTLGNSYFYILHDKLLINEKLSRHNDFHYFSLGMLFIFPSKEQ